MMQDAIDICNNPVVSAAKAQKGFQVAYLMTDAGSGKALSITVWETEADMQAGEPSGGYYQQQIAKFGSLMARPPILEHYEFNVEASA